MLTQFQSPCRQVEEVEVKGEEEKDEVMPGGDEEEDGVLLEEVQEELKVV